jgi:hypothetical protein
MRKRTTLAAAGLALAAAGALAGMSLAGPDGIGEPREANESVVAKPITGVAGEAARRGGGRRGPTIDFFYARNPTVPPEGGGEVQPIRCPRGAGQPIAGGARTSEGIVVSYLSRAHPETSATPRRTYFVGVDDNAGEPGAGAFVEVQCAKGMTVRD